MPPCRGTGIPLSAGDWGATFGSGSRRPGQASLGRRRFDSREGQYRVDACGRRPVPLHGGRRRDDLPYRDLDTASTEKIRDAQVHVEFMIPYMPDAKGWARGNSGIILLNRYEVQIVDSYKNDTGASSESCGGFESWGPLVNACRPPAEWQSYDIVFHAPRCASDGSTQTPGSLTVFQNGVLVQDHAPVRGRRCVEEGPIVLQDHSRVVGRTIAISQGVQGPAPDTIMKFRNIWIRRLAPSGSTGPYTPGTGRDGN